MANSVMPSLTPFYWFTVHNIQDVYLSNYSNAISSIDDTGKVTINSNHLPFKWVILPEYSQIAY